jgi:hypothetical protein
VASTYSNLKIQLMATGENSGTWGNVTNANLGDAIEQALVETATVTFASANVTLTLSDSNSRQNARALRLNLTGTTAGARDLIVPAIQKPYLVNNGTADTITVKVSGQTGVAVPASTSMLLYNNGTDVIVAFNRVVGNVVGDLTGTASNATVLQTARNIQISGNVTAANVSFDGSAAVNLSVTDINAAGITSGTLGVARGGTAASTLTAENVIIGNGTSAVKFVAPGTSGNVLTSNGSAWASQAIAAGGNFVQQVYSSPATWSKPATVKAVRVTVIGGGGGGNGSRGNPEGGILGAGGAGGGVAIEYLSAPAIPGPVTVTVGAGGTGGPAPGSDNTRSAGGTGGTTSFGPFLSATGGAGGLSTPTGNASGGIGSGGDLNIAGGRNNVNAFTVSGEGLSGTNPFFVFDGAISVTGSTNGNAAPGTSRGTGGGGAATTNTTPRSGGAGSGGLVIVEEFY